MSRCTKTLIQVALALTFSSTAIAEGAFEDLQTGATLPEVLKAWGHPSEKIERDVRHEVRWNYSQGAFVLFKNGHVVDWRSARGRSPASIKKAAEVTPLPDKANAEMGDLVRDIAREVPGGPDVALPEPPGGAAGQGSLVPNAVPPPGVAPGEEVDPSEVDQ